jgi:SNF family Na+-dependent transporter
VAQKSTEQWGTRIGVIMAVAASAVGLGNFLRFPGLAAQNGGGAFLIPYFIALLLLGIPLGWAEWTMGRYGGLRGFHSAPGIFSVIWRHPLAKYLGGLALLVPLGIYMYYVVIEAWCLGYAWYYLTGELQLGAEPARYTEFFDSFTGGKADGSLVQGSSPLLLFFVVTVAANFFLIYRGISKGIEAFCTWALPIMGICAIFVLIRVLTLPAPFPDKPEQNLINGLGFMWNPKFESLANPNTWLLAASQVFFTLGVGFGIVINYSSYLKKKDDVALSNLTACSMNEFYEVCLGGMITIPAAFMFLGALSSDQSGTFGLGFKVLPNVFAQMPAGRLFGFLWFFMLFLAAITSSISMLQPVLAFLEEGLGLKRLGAASLLGAISLIGSGVVIYFSKAGVALDTIDFWVGTIFIFILATVQAILYGWVLGIERGEQEMHHGAQLRVPRFVQYVLKYVTPTYLLAVLIGTAYTSGSANLKTLLTNRVAGITFSFVIAVMAFLSILIYFAGRRWEAEGRFKSLSKDGDDA